MNRTDFIHQLERYQPFNGQEASDRAVMLQLLRSDSDNLALRCNPAHFTASGWIVNPKRDRVLMAYHNIYHAWSWLGGHLDGDWDAARVALREAQEEGGVSVSLLSPELFSLEILTVDGHEKRGEYVSSHLHLNVTYLLQADDTAPLTVKADENSAVQWFALQEAPKASSEMWMRERIYEKLNARLARWESK